MDEVGVVFSCKSQGCGVSCKFREVCSRSALCLRPKGQAHEHCCQNSLRRRPERDGAEGYRMQQQRSRCLTFTGYSLLLDVVLVWWRFRCRLQH